jgi:hypothetical protein
MKPHKHAEVAHAYIDGKECEYWSEWDKTWQPIYSISYFNNLELKVRIKPKPDYTEELTLFWNKAVPLISYRGMGQEWLQDGKHYQPLGDFVITWDGETGEPISIRKKK